ncbi:MAG: conjugal transfer protein TraR [Bacteroidetes bacterium]|nr:MAG: conjugal transfer protein TraR [Bacteroidota bacterium]
MAKTQSKKSSPKKTKPAAKAKAVKPVKKPAPVKKEAPKAKPVPQKLVSTAKGYSKKDLEYFRDIILEKKKEILEELETLRDTMMDSTTGEYTNENPTYSTHMEQGTDTMEREKTFLFASRESKFFNYLEDALKRIDAGEYGRCQTCGKLIEKERLEAVPHSQQCLSCKLQRSK